MSGEFKLVSVLNPTVVLTAGPAISAGANSQVSGTIQFVSSAGNVTFGMDGAGNVTASAPTGGGAADGYNILAAGTQTAGTAATIKFADSNGITFGMSNSSQITASHNGIASTLADATYYPRITDSNTVTPNGLPDRTQFTYSWSDATRTLTITPTGANFVVWSNGTRYVKSTPQDFVFADTEGRQYAYFDDSGNPQTTTTFSTDLILRWAITGILYWDAVNNVAVPDLQVEYHGTDWPPEIHLQQHLTVGCTFQSGLDLTLTPDQDGSVLSHIGVAGAQGYIWDEDIQHNIAARLASDNIPVLYRTGASLWRYDNSSAALARATGTGRAAYNLDTAGTWSLEEMTDGYFSVVYVCTGSGLTKQWFAVMHTAEYATLDDATTAARAAPDMTGLPFQEFRIVGAVVFETSDTFTNAVKSRVRYMVDGSAWIDWRNERTVASTVSYGNNIQIVADGVTYANGPVSFGNSNGFSFKTSNGSIVGSYTVPTQTQFVLSNGGGVSFGTAGSTVTATVKTDYAGTGFTGTNISGTLNSNGLALSVAPGGGGADGYNILAAGTQTAGTATTVNFANSNNVSFGMDGSSQITASIGTLPLNTISNPNGEALINMSSYGYNLRWLNGSVSTNGTRAAAFELDFGGPFAGHAVHIHEHGTATSATGHVLHILAENTGMSALVVNATGPANVYLDGPVSYSGGSVPMILGTSQSNGVANLNANYLQGRVSSYFAVSDHGHTNYLTTARASNDAIGLNTAITQNGVSMTANSSGLSLNFPAFLTTAQPVGAYLTTARASNDAVGLNAALTAGPLAWTVNSSGISLNAGSAAGTTTGFAGNLISGSMTHNTAGLNVSLNHPAWLTTAAQSNHSHGNPTLALTNLSGTTNSASNGFTISLSAAAPSGGTQSLYAVSNTTQSTSGTYTNGLSFAGAGIASVGISNGSVVVSVPAGGGAGDGYNIIQAGTTGTTGTAWSSLSATVFLNGSNMTVSQNNSNQIVLIAPASSSMVAGANITLSTNGSTVSVIGAAGGGGITYSGYRPYADREHIAGQQGQGTICFDPDVMQDVQFDRICIPIYNTNSSNSSGSHTISYWVGLYTKNASTLSLWGSTSTSVALTHSGTAGSYSLYSGMRLLTIPWTTTVPAGNYWFANLSRTTSGGANGSYSQLLLSQLASNFLGHFGSSHNTTMQFVQGQGVYTATSNGMPGSVAFSQIRGSDSLAQRAPKFYFASGTA